ncbi:hypothetical protein [Streptomyces sp. NBC_00083]|uniref:hypothetical protein n=1 Tax=Streptomyces sp. NBC_00083 TaxID=2975647 RepID=UPI002253F1A7|nr:hypothetical protein [Streptomyces sp. NBC_00083]MCX5383914.1 hypothetical protein [Streptomyces sp. NBC_00083]
MEQRSEHQYLPLTGAATDPSYVPGLVPPRATAPEEVLPDAARAADATAEAGADAADAADPTAAEPEADGGAGGGDEAEADGDARGEAGDTAEAHEANGTDDAGDRPAYEISDRVGSIVADHRGIRLRLHEEEADFRWDEVSAVEYSTPRWSRRFEIAVYTAAPRRFSHDVQAADRAELARWSEQLEAVLDAYFEN